MKDPEYRQQVFKQGLNDYKDEFAYFASGFAINGVPITKEGYVHLFKRDEKAQIHPGHWHVIGGVLDTDLKLFENEDPSRTLKEKIRNNIRKEFEEETAAYNVRVELTGLARNLEAGFVEFTHAAYIDSSSEEFLEGRLGAAEASDHYAVSVLKSKEELYRFLKSGEKIVPTGRSALEIYLTR